MQQYGADILRLWVAQTDYAVDQRIGPEILKGTADSYRRLRNTLRFLLGALDGFGEAERIEPAEMPELERWVLHRLAELDRRGARGLRRLRLPAACSRALFQFCTVDLSAFYFDIRKDALYCDAADSPRRRAARTVLDALFHRLVTWLAPMLPFTMEEVWLERFPGEESSVHLAGLPRDAGRRGSTPRSPRSGRRSARPAASSPARWRSSAATSGSAPASRRRRWSTSPTPALRAALASVDFADVCITSDLHADRRCRPRPDAFALDDVPGVAVVPALADGEKCARCWKILPDVGTHAHPGVCARCDAALG